MSITVDSCVKKQNSDPVNDYFSGNQLREYCECHAKKFYSLITKQELEYSNKNRTMDNVKGKISKSHDYCKSTLAKKWIKNESEYVAMFKGNVYLICHQGLITGSDPIPTVIVKQVCQCYSNDMAGKLTVEQMRDSDKNQDKYAALAEKIMATCVNKVISKN